jgi:hypothetical protein
VIGKIRNPKRMLAYAASFLDLRILKNFNVTRASGPCLGRGVEEIVAFLVFEQFSHGPEARVTIVPPDFGALRRSHFRLCSFRRISGFGFRI